MARVPRASTGAFCAFGASFNSDCCGSGRHWYGAAGRVVDGADGGADDGRGDGGESADSSSSPSCRAFSNAADSSFA